MELSKRVFDAQTLKPKFSLPLNIEKLKFGALFTLLILSSCTKDTPLLKELSCEEKEILANAGINSDGAKIIDDYILVEEDLLVARKSLKEWQIAENKFKIDGGDGEAELRQYASGKPEVVNISQAGEIAYYIDPAVSGLPAPGSGPNWNDAIHTAVANWKAIIGCRVAFVEVFTHEAAQLSFFTDGPSTTLPSGLQNLPSSNLARSCFANNGNVGRFISINDNPSSPAGNTTLRESVMMHEIGHTLGLLHTNTTPASEFVDGCNNTIAGSELLPFTGTTDLSIMNTPSGGASTFSPLDIRAAQMLYPFVNTNFVINTVSPGDYDDPKHLRRKFDVSITPPPVGTQAWYKIRFVLSFSEGGQVIFERPYHPTETVYNFVWYAGATYTIQAFGVNYKGDFVGFDSNIKTFAL